MPFVLLAIGAIFLVAGIRGTESDYTVNGTQYKGLFTLIKGDFSGPSNFIYWFAAIFLIGSVGYIQPLKKVSDSFIVLVIVSMFVAKSQNGVSGGFFTKFIQALNTPATGAPDAAKSTSMSGATSDSEVANGLVTMVNGVSTLGNGVENMGTSTSAPSQSGANSSGIGGVTNFGTSYNGSDTSGFSGLSSSDYGSFVDFL